MRKHKVEYQKWVIGLLVTILALFIASHLKTIASIQEDIKDKVDNEYFYNTEQRILDRLDRIEEKIDKIIESNGKDN